MSKPSDICVVLAALHGRSDGWCSADEVAHRLGKLGFECTSQQVAAWLTRCARMEAPSIEARDADTWWPWKAYRVTTAGRTWISNLLPDIWNAQRQERDATNRALATALSTTGRPDA